MTWVHVKDYTHPKGWHDPAQAETLARSYCEQLEAGQILFFSAFPFDFPPIYIQALLTKKQSALRFHKNISYQPQGEVLRGQDGPSRNAVYLRGIMRAFSTEASRFAADFLRPYAGKFKVDFASYRPTEEYGRALTLHKRNDLLHVDAFPSRPTHGERILRVFANINSSQPRSWITSYGFEDLARRYAAAAGLEKVAKRSGSLWWKMFQKVLAWPQRWRGRESATPSAYDQFMCHFHNWLKESREFQLGCPKSRHQFPPGSAWMVYTDCVPHAVIAGQFAMEQTLVVDVDAMVTPQQAPIRILERLCGRPLAA